MTFYLFQMSEEHFDEFEHFNYDQDKMMHAGQSGKFDSSSRAQKKYFIS